MRTVANDVLCVSKCMFFFLCVWFVYTGICMHRGPVFVYIYIYICSYVQGTVHGSIKHVHVFVGVNV
jgi:hypothetical protein